MSLKTCASFCFMLFFIPGCARSQVAAPTASLVETEPGVKVEVYDWGGSGPALVLLAGLGAKGSVFDNFARALLPRFHVYAIVRRGYGHSSAPEPTAENYSADRLADDVLGVIDRLHMFKPLVVGHSLAGEELSSIGSRHPERVAGLVYLDAGYRYALSGPGLNDLQIDMITMRRYLSHASDDVDPAQAKRSVDAFLGELPEFEKELQAYSQSLGKAAPVSAVDIANEEKARLTTEGRAERAILDSEQRYSSVKCPMLVVFAYPHDLPASVTGADRESREKADMAFVDQRLRLFKAQPDVKVVLLPHATHGVQDSRRDEVLKEIEVFAAKVQK
jgi:non-heme chloroperoxidase